MAASAAGVPGARSASWLEHSTRKLVTAGLPLGATRRAILRRALRRGAVTEAEAARAQGSAAQSTRRCAAPANQSQCQRGPAAPYRPSPLHSLLPVVPVDGGVHGEALLPGHPHSQGQVLLAHLLVPADHQEPIDYIPNQYEEAMAGRLDIPLGCDLLPSAPGAPGGRGWKAAALRGLGAAFACPAAAVARTRPARLSHRPCRAQGAEQRT